LWRMTMANEIRCERCGKTLRTGTESIAHRASCKIYNGWSTFETWLVALWLDNEETSYHYLREGAREAQADVDYAEDAAPLALAERLKEEHEEAAQARLGSTADVFWDLLESALTEVDWCEIAEHLLGE